METREVIDATASGREADGEVVNRQCLCVFILRLEACGQSRLCVGCCRLRLLVSVASSGP